MDLICYVKFKKYFLGSMFLMDTVISNLTHALQR